MAALDVLFGESRPIYRPGGSIIILAMHPAMMLLGIQARFRDPATGRDIRPARHANQIADYVMGVTRAGLHFDRFSEHVIDEELAARSPRAAKCLNWPMLLLMRLRAQRDEL